MIAAVFATVFAMQVSQPQELSAEDFARRWKVVSEDNYTESTGGPEFGRLVDLFAQSAIYYRGEINAALAVGRQPRACPPLQISFFIDEFVAEIDKLSPPKKADAVSVVMGRILDARFPCPDK